VGRFQVVNGFSNEFGHIYIAQGLVQTPDNRKEEEGITQVKKVPFKKILRMIAREEISDGQSMNALIRAAMKLRIIST